MQLQFYRPKALFTKRSRGPESAEMWELLMQIRAFAA